MMPPHGNRQYYLPRLPFMIRVFPFLILVYAWHDGNKFASAFVQRPIALTTSPLTLNTQHLVSNNPSKLSLKYLSLFSPSKYAKNTGLVNSRTMGPGIFSYKNEESGAERSPSFESQDAVVRASALSLRRSSWFSWWAQVILTSVSSVTLLFAKSVLDAAKGTAARTTPNGGFFLAGSGITISIFSIFWTWGGARLSRRLVRRNASRIMAANLFRRTITIGVSLNLMGMLVTLIGAEQIVGLLAAKVLTMQGVFPGSGVGLAGVTAQTIQPLDILIVQANTNTLLSHFFSLLSGLYLTKIVHRLDPPSVDDGNKTKDLRRKFK